jgi:hypothetical protein
MRMATKSFSFFQSVNVDAFDHAVIIQLCSYRNVILIAGFYKQQRVALWVCPRMTHVEGISGAMRLKV